MIFAENLGEPEGPVALNGGSWLAVEMGPERGCVTQIDRDGRIAQVIARTGRPNGLEEQRIYVTEDEFGRVEAFEVGTDGLRLYT